MKSLTLALIFTITLIISHETADAQSSGFGIGATIGSTDGISYTARVSESSAVNGAVSFSLSDNFSWFYTHLDYTAQKPYENLDWEAGDLYYYYGGGARVTWYDGLDSVFGVRLPAGIGFDFTNVPINLFFELAPSADLSPDFSFGFDGNIGFRFYVN